MKAILEASVIIPTLNRCVLLENAINSVIKQDFDCTKFEIIIVDNGSADGTKNIVSELIKRNPHHAICYIYDDVPGLLTGRHRGAKEAKSDILIFVDDDIEASPGWLEAICSTFRDPDIQLVGGKCLPIYDVVPPEWEKSLWSRNNGLKMCCYYSLIDQGDIQKDTDPNYIFGLNFCIRKQAFFDCGGFHPDCIPKRLQKYQGDGETGLTMKFTKKGLRAVYEPKALIYHHVTQERLTVEYLENRMFYSGVGHSYSLVRNHSKAMATYALVLRKIKINAKALLLFLKDKINFIPALEEYHLRALRKKMKIAYQEGFDFHQTEIKKDPELIRWIKKENYFDYELPNQQN